MQAKRTKSGRKHSDNRSVSLSENETANSLQLGFEHNALKIKNEELVKFNTRLKQENAEYKNQIYDLQAENVNLCAKYNRVDKILKNLSHKSRLCMPKIIDLLNLMLQVTEDNNMLSSPLGSLSTSRVGASSSPRKTTQTVKPHTVNGTVLLRPTISLTRLGIPEDYPQPSTSNSQNLNGEYRPNSSQENVASFNGETSTASLKRTPVNRSSDEESDHDDENNDSRENSAEQSFVSRASKRNPSAHAYLDDSFEEEADIENEAEEEEMDENQEPANQHKQLLDTICEEGEVTIMLERLNDAQMRNAMDNNILRRSLNESNSSTLPQVDATLLDRTFSEVESPDELRASKRLRVDVTLFEPRGNSTSYDMPSSSASPSPQKRSLTLTDMSQLQITPERSVAEGVTWLMTTTPSASAMGDNTDKLAILEGLGLCPTPTKELLENGDSSACASTPRSPRTRSSTLANQVKGKSLISPPLNRLSFVCKTRGNGSPIESPVVVLRRLEDEIPNNTPIPSRSRSFLKKTPFPVKPKSILSYGRNSSPVVLLERLEKLSPSTQMNVKVLSSIINTTVAKTSSDITTNRKPTKSRSKPKQSKKKSSKVEESQDENLIENNESLHEKIKEVQKRLSSYDPSQMSGSSEDSPIRGRGRPPRAAKPINLKEAPLNKKMRR